MKWKNWRYFSFLHSTPLQEEYLSMIKILSLNLLARYRICEMKWIEWMIREILKIGGCWQRGGNLWDAVEHDCTGFCEPIIGWSKTTKTNFCQINHKFLLVGEKIWTHIQPQYYSPTDYSLSTKLIILLLCHGCLPREDDGSFEFLRMNDNLQKHVQHRHRWADEKWRTEWEEEDKKKISVLSRFFRNNSVFPGSPRSFWTQPYESFITVIILDGIFEFFNHVGYAINLHSIINSRLIPGRQILSNRQTVFFLFVDPLDKERKHLDTIELEAPRLAHPCGKHGRDIRILCIGRHQHCSEERIEVSDTIERHHPLRNTSSLLYPESCSDGNLRSRKRKSFCVTSSSSKDFFATWLDEIIGFRSCSTNRWTSCSTIHKNTTKPTKLNPKSW